MAMKSVRRLKELFGYAFNADGKLRKIDKNSGKLTDEPFQYEISQSRSINQANYEALGQIVTDYVYYLLETNGLTRHYIPCNIPEEEASFIYCTLNEIQPVEKLMIIVHGSGVVRAGQWSRSLIINDSIDTGTVLPYIKRAKQEGYEVIVTNTNYNKRDDKFIQDSADPKQHAETVAKEIVLKTEAKHIVIVAHSYGGTVTCYLARKYEDAFNKRVKAVVFTDSVHCRKNTTKHLAKVGVNFVASESPVNTQLSKHENLIEERSAGTIKHELTSYSCIDYAFQFIKEKESSQ